MPLIDPADAAIPLLTLSGISYRRKALAKLSLLALGFLGLGVIEGLTRVFYPEASATVVFIVMAIVLPKGSHGGYSESLVVPVESVKTVGPWGPSGGVRVGLVANHGPEVLWSTHGPSGVEHVA